MKKTKIKWWGVFRRTKFEDSPLLEGIFDNEEDAVGARNFHRLIPDSHYVAPVEITFTPPKKHGKK